MKVRFDKSHFGLLTAAAAATLTAFSCGDRAETYTAEARRYERDYDFERAADRYELVVIGFKRSPFAADARAGLDRCRGDVHYDRAEALIFDGAAYTALAEIAAGRRLAPGNPRGLYLAGLAHLWLGPRDVAFQEFNACILRYPESPYGYLGRGEYFRLQLARADAFNEYLRAFRTAGRDARARAAAFRGLRDMTLKLGNAENTLAPYYGDAAAAVGADAFEYWLGHYYMHKPPALYADARSHFDAALKTRGNTVYAARARAGLAECDFFSKDYARAKALIDAAIAADPTNDAYYASAAKIYGHLGLPPPAKGQK